MINVENIDVWGFEHAIRGMRNPMNSWAKSDSRHCSDDDPFTQEYFGCDGCPLINYNCDLANEYIIGTNDLTLMKKLYRAGTEHRKYLRQIFVSADITAPLYWWKEFDTYKIGTVSNSCSTMHKIAAKEFELDDFSHEHLCEGALIILKKLIYSLNTFREAYLDTSNKDHWWQLIQLLPSSYNQKRTITMNYENVVSMINQRHNHKLDEWNDFVACLRGLPYIREIIDE